MPDLQLVYLRASRENVGDDGVAFGRLQIRAVRHAVHDLRPIARVVMPDYRQRMAFDATASEKRPTLLQRC